VVKQHSSMSKGLRWPIKIKGGYSFTEAKHEFQTGASV